MEFQTMESKYVRAMCFTLLALFAMAPAVHAGYPVRVPSLQPYQVRSADGTWLLDVKPSHRYGSGPSTATLIRQETGEVKWKQELPFTFWQCCVNEEGYVGGYGYTKGPMGGEPYGEDGGDFVVRILDPNGVVGYAETTSRGKLSMIANYTPSISARWLTIDPTSDRMVIVMNDDTMRIYHLRIGVLESALPTIQRDSSDISDSLVEIRFIGDPRMMLLRYDSWDSSDNNETFGSRFVLINFLGKVIWSLDRIQTLPSVPDRVYPRYTILSPDIPFWVDPFAEKVLPNPDPFAAAEENPNLEDPFAPVEIKPAPPSAPAPLISVADFELFLGDSGEKVTYTLARTDDERHPKWSVTEKARAKHTLAPEPDMEESPAPEAPEIKAKKLSEFSLTLPTKENLQDLPAVAVGADGKIYVIEEKSKSLHVFDANGKFLHTCQTQGHELVTEWYNTSLTVTSTGDVLVKLASEALEEHFLRFDAAGKLKDEKLEFSSDYTSKIIARPAPMCFLGNGYREGISAISIEGHDRSGGFGKLIKRPDGQWLDFIQDIAVAENGDIAVRETTEGDNFGGFVTPFSRLPPRLPTDVIAIYSADGTPLRTLDFTKFAGLDRIAFGGGHIVATGNFFPAQPRIYVFTDEGEPVGAFDAEISTKDTEIDLRLFLVSQGKEIVVVDKKTAKVLCYEIPKP